MSITKPNSALNIEKIRIDDMSPAGSERESPPQRHKETARQVPSRIANRIRYTH